MHMPKIPQDIFKSPLGIIGAFIFLVYGVAGLVFSVTSRDLDFFLQTILVSFIALYPCVILWVFYLLVTKHSDNLYAPSDFHTNEAFLAYKGATAAGASSQQTTISDYSPEETTASPVTETPALTKPRSKEDNAASIDTALTITSAAMSGDAKKAWNAWVQILGKEAVAINALLQQYRHTHGAENVTEMRLPGCDILVQGAADSNYIDVKLITSRSLVHNIVANARIQGIKNRQLFRSLSGTKHVVNSIAFVIDETDPILIQATSKKIHAAAGVHAGTINYSIYVFSEIASLIDNLERIQPEQ